MTAVVARAASRARPAVGAAAGDPASASPSRGPILVVTVGIAAAFYLEYRDLATEGLRAWVT